MVIDKIKKAFSANDEKYEALYYKYSQIKLENSKLKDKHRNEMSNQKTDIQKKVARELIKLFEEIETAKNDSFKVSAMDKDMQRVLMGLNKSEKTLKQIMTDMSMEEITENDTFYDPELHEIASYSDAKGMKAGMIIKTAKKGFKFKGEIIKKPRVVVTK